LEKLNRHVPRTNQKANHNVNADLICCAWNVKAGLGKRELEIRNLLKTEKIDILFLNETDSVNIHKESDYNIEGFSTILQKRKFQIKANLSNKQ
jgi:hypothetical protein